MGIYCLLIYCHAVFRFLAMLSKCIGLDELKLLEFQKNQQTLLRCILSSVFPHSL